MLGKSCSDRCTTVVGAMTTIKRLGHKHSKEQILAGALSPLHATTG